MYKHGTYSLYLRVKKKIQSLKQGEREKQKLEAKNHFSFKTMLIKRKCRIAKPPFLINNNQIGATLSAPRGKIKIWNKQ